MLGFPTDVFLSLMKGISARVGEAITKLHMNDTENSMLQAACAIDATARRRFGTKAGNRERFTGFLEKEEDFLIYGALSFTTHIYVKGRLSFSGLGTLPELIYKSVRNPLIHEAETGDDVILLPKEQEVSFGFKDNKFAVSQPLILTMLLLVVGAKENEHSSFDRPWMLTVNGKDLSLNHLWGQMDIIKRQVGFEERPPELVA